MLQLFADLLKRLAFLAWLCCPGILLFGQNSLFLPAPFLVAEAPGSIPFSSCATDMNGDGLDDLVRVGYKGIFIDFQQKNGTFIQRFYAVPVTLPPSWSICAGDLDNNGYTDLCFGDEEGVAFVLANATGSAYTSFNMPPHLFSQRSTMADINNDGWLDAFVCNDTGQSQVFRNIGQGTMQTDPAFLPTSPRPGNYAAIWTDLDNDHDLDLYISKCKGGALPGDPNRTNLLYINDGSGNFTENAAAAGLADNAQSWCTVFDDFDNDGDFDAFTINHDFANRLYRNNSDGTFTDVILASGIAVNATGVPEECFAADFDNDGNLDIFSELSKEMYLGHGDMTFSGLDLPVYTGAVADMNNDGFPDIVNQSQVWLNTTNTNHWVKFQLSGIVSNKNGIGARVTLYGPWGIQTREQRSGQGYSPMHSLNIHFGLGNNTAIDSVLVEWPSGITTLYRHLEADSLYLIPEQPCLTAGFTLESASIRQICQGDTLTLTASGPFESLLWSDGTTGPNLNITRAGQYYAMGIDSNQCAAVSNRITVQEITENQPNIKALSGLSACAGDTLWLKTNADLPLLWSDGTMNTQQIPATQSGWYSVAHPSVCNDGWISSDSLLITIYPADAPIVADTIIWKGDSVLLTVNGVNCVWYDQPSGGNIIATGNTFQTPVLTDPELYFVESQYLYAGEQQQGGKADTLGTGGLSTQTGYLNVEVWESFTLQSVSVYVPPGAPLTNRFVQIISNNTIIYTHSFPVQTGWNELGLNVTLMPGYYSIRCPQGNLYRNNGVLAYPYAVGTVGQITSSSLGEQYYFYFYNWKIRRHDVPCISARIPVMVDITPAQEAFSNISYRVFPNPATRELVIALPTGATEYKLQLIDLHGVVQRVGVNQPNMNIAGLTPGFYMLKIQTPTNHWMTKILIQHTNE